jgi:hypothetical protein
MAARIAVVSEDYPKKIAVFCGHQQASRLTVSRIESIYGRSLQTASFFVDCFVVAVVKISHII